MRLVQAVQVVKQCLMDRTGHKAMVDLHIISTTGTLTLQPIRLVRVVKQWFMSRTVGEVQIIGVT